MTGDSDRETALPPPLREVIDSPEQGVHRLPYLLGLLDEGDRQARLAASTAICQVVERDADLLETAVRRLADRLGDDDLEARHALAYLAARRPERVDEALADLADDRELRARERLSEPAPGFARNQYLVRTGGGRPLVRAHRDADDDPRRASTDPDGSSADADSPSTGGERADSVPSHGPLDDADDATDDGEVTSGELTALSRKLSAIAADSRFDDLSVLAERRRERHADVYRCLAERDGDTYPVALWLFRIPDGDAEAFAADVRDRLEQWAAVDDHEAIRTVRDWGVDPRPWAALEYAAETMADRGAVTPEAAAAEVARLADAVAHAHRGGVVHGGIDPQTVGYYGDRLSDAEPSTPLLSAFGLAPLSASYGGRSAPAARYAAPEHVDDRFGSVGPSTDVYGLGAVLYRRCTGRDPYEGEDPIDRALQGDPPAPSAVADVPAELDRVVGKAMATRRLSRYETARQLAGDLRALAGDVDG